jgi:hypothetical protein
MRSKPRTVGEQREQKVGNLIYLRLPTSVAGHALAASTPDAAAALFAKPNSQSQTAFPLPPISAVLSVPLQCLQLLHQKAAAPLGGLVGVELVNVLEVNLELKARMNRLAGAGG